MPSNSSARRRSSRPVSQVERPSDPTPESSQRTTPTPAHDGRGLANSSLSKRKSRDPTASIGVEPSPGSRPNTRRSSVGKRPATSRHTQEPTQSAHRRRSGVPASMSATNGGHRAPPPLPLSSISQSAEPTVPPARPSTPPPPDLSATYMPGDGDFFGSPWAGTPSSRPRVDEQSSASTPNVGSPERGQPSSSKASYSASSNATKPTVNDSPRRNNAGPSRAERGVGFGDGEEREKKSRHKKAPSQKAMLAKALEKANHAVVLDNAQNYEQAMTAYHDACNLLHQVMTRTSGEEDKNKLDAIRKTYKVRIQELRTNELAGTAHAYATDKALPEVPRSATNSVDMSGQLPPDEEALEITPTAPTASLAPESDASTERLHPRTASRDHLPPRRQSLSPQSMPLLSGEDRRKSPERRASPAVEDGRAPSPRKTSAPVAEAPKQNGDPRNLSVPMDSKYVPAPLSPWRVNEPMALPSAESQPSNTTPKASTPSFAAPTPNDLPKEHQPARAGHVRTDTAGSTSWLDTIGESGASSSSSTRSPDSMDDIRHGHYRQGSGATEADFDSALDAAIEAAYDQGFEPVSDEELFDHEPLTMATTLHSISDARKNVDRARLAVQEAEREAAIAAAKDRERQRRIENPWPPRSGLASHGDDLDFQEMEAEDEERLLEEMTKDYLMEDPIQMHRTKQAAPRQSDSSSFSARAWGSSLGSAPATVGTPLSTVDEAPVLAASAMKKQAPPPISTTLPGVPQPQFQVPLPPPPIPKQGPPEPPSAAILSPGVRERRLSGQKAKALKIDTGTRSAPGQGGARTHPTGPIGMPGSSSDMPKSATVLRDQLDPSQHQSSLLQFGPRTASPYSGPSPEPPSGTRDTPGGARDPMEHRSLTPASPGRPRATLKKNFSTSSLKSARSTDDLPSTPLGRVFSAASRKETIPTMPDLPVNAPHNFTRSLTTGSMSFFDNDMHSPEVPGSPNPFYANAPIPLEPCPEVPALRPFWLMRCIYQTISHPRGGYVSRRLFIPRDIWRVKNVKLRNVDDKVSQLDLLTAGLMNLSKVDTLDADAVLEVMQSFELLLDQVQGTLTKKLGSEVGVQGTSMLFKGSPVVDEGTMPDLMSSKDKNKSYFSSLRKLRNKSSTGPGPGGLTVSKDGKDSIIMKSLPMTPLMNVKFVKRDPTKILGIGPHAHYMAALARLCDAVQVVDQIARQVEDPGLKFSSTAHVGLELSTKHAAEFFGFYVCRFALADIGMMLDKFIKRGSEWVMG